MPRAVMASNYMVMTIDAAVTLLRQTRSENDALPALAPLIRASVANSLAWGPAKALTGPIERGDVQTVAAHLEALRAGARISARLISERRSAHRRRGPAQISGRRSGHHRVSPEKGSVKQPMNEMRVNEIKVNEPKKIWPHHLKEMKQRGEKIAMLTAYDALMARMFDQAGIDVLLVGDSLGMVLLGYSTTLPVTLDEMVHHTKAVSARNAPRTDRRRHAVPQLPGLDRGSGAQRGRLIQEGGANSVKLEGGRAMAETVARLVEIGIPVMGHLGLNPQVGESDRRLPAAGRSRRKTRGG